MLKLFGIVDMNLEDQVISLNYAIRLQELGIKQDSLFYWYRDLKKDKWGICYTKGKIITDQFYSAFTVAELGEMLPLWSEIGKRARNDWVCVVMEKNSVINHHSCSEKEADARAKMIIFLIENGSMKVDK